MIMMSGVSVTSSRTLEIDQQLHVNIFVLSRLNKRNTNERPNMAGNTNSDILIVSSCICLIHQSISISHVISHCFNFLLLCRLVRLLLSRSIFWCIRLIRLRRGFKARIMQNSTRMGRRGR